ncbi:hypothetical protein K2V61_12850 [Staphylococcus simulans]|nr:hypothetical protein [Staphylococcus simulans]MCD8916419.1 hypothetical protein [Staphylococcus simulans]
MKLLLWVLPPFTSLNQLMQQGLTLDVLPLVDLCFISYGKQYFAGDFF